MTGASTGERREGGGDELARSRFVEGGGGSGPVGGGGVTRGGGEAVGVTVEGGGGELKPADLSSGSWGRGDTSTHDKNMCK